MIRGMSCLTIMRSARGALPLLGLATSKRGDGLVACSALGQQAAFIQIVRQASRAGVTIVSLPGKAH